MAMTATNKAERAIVKALAPYLLAWPQNKMNEASLAIYARALSNLPLAEISAAMLRLLRTCKFFPSVAEIVEAAEAMRQFATKSEVSTPDEAWAEAMRLARECHVYKEWHYSCPEVEQAVKYFGRVELCTLEADAVNTARSQFMRIYTSVAGRGMARRHNEAVMAALPPRQREALQGVGQLTESLAANMALPMPKGAKA